jgi:phosphohistidine phosphatase
MPTKTLYIARHAKSSWDDPTLSDFDRPLNARGMRDAPFMAGQLVRRGVHPDLILASPALRARTTAETYHAALGGDLRFDERIYEASLMSLIYLVQEAFEQTDTLMLVGHNPGLTALNDHLGGPEVYNLPTAAVTAIAFDGAIEPYSGKGLWFLSPKRLKGTFKNR